MKVFISQPMSDRPEEDIMLERTLVIEVLKEKYGDVEIVGGYFDGPEPPLNKLGKNIAEMAYADMVIFLPGWQESRGCMIEYHCATEYDLECFELNAKEVE